MAYENAIPAVGSTDLPQNEKKVIMPAEPWSDAWALDHVNQDFNLAEQYRTLNHDWRYRNSDELYLAWMTQKYWEGTRIPRSNLGIYVALEQVESLLPKIVSNMFAEGDKFFEASPEPGTTEEQAESVRDILIYHLKSDHSHPQNRVREVFRRVFKEACIYGNGVAEIGWTNSSRKRRRLERKFVPVMSSLDLSPLGLGKVPLPSGKFRSVVAEKEYNEEIDRPFLRHIGIKDFFIDPNCQVPQVQGSHHCFVRTYKTVQEMAELRDTYQFQIPSDSELVELAQQKPYANADWTKMGVEMVRTGFWMPHVDQTSDPAGKRLEVIAGWYKDRLVWLMNRKKVALNVANPYGFLPFFSAYYVDVPSRWHGLSVCDVVEGEQRNIQAIINGRMDELALNLHPPMIKRRGLTIPMYQLRQRPGQIIEAENPDKDIIRREPSMVTQQAYVEVQASEQRVQKYTGITDLALMGAPSTGGNSASRTATGVSTQAQASFSRIQYIVENQEDTFVEPLLAALFSLEQRFLDPNKYTEILGPDEGSQLKRLTQIDHLDVMNADCRFQMRASAKMQARTTLLQELPLVLQTLMNPEFMNLLAQQSQQTVNMKEISQMLADATGYRWKSDLFIPLSAEQKQAMSKPSPDAMAKIEQQKQRTQGQLEIEELKQHHAMAQQIVGGALDAMNQPEEQPLGV